MDGDHENYSFSALFATSLTFLLILSFEGVREPCSGDLEYYRGEVVNLNQTTNLCLFVGSMLPVSFIQDG